MADLTNYRCYSNTKYEILTHEGFKDFKGLLIGDNPNKIKLKLSYNKELICTPKHKLFSEEGKIIFAENLQVGSRLYGGVEVISIEKYIDEKNVYEILEVSDNHAYYANGVLSHQCLVIDEMAFI